MAKKDVAEMSVEQKLKTLYQLQTTLSAIDEKRALRGELPLEVQDKKECNKKCDKAAKQDCKKNCDKKAAK